MASIQATTGIGSVKMSSSPKNVRVFSIGAFRVGLLSTRKKCFQRLVVKSANVVPKVDFHVVFPKYTGTEVVLNGSKHLILKEDDIVGIVKNEDIKDLKLLNKFKVTELESKTDGGLLLTKAAERIHCDGPTLADLINMHGTTTVAFGMGIMLGIPGLMVAFIIYLIFCIICDIKAIFRLRKEDELVDKLVVSILQFQVYQF
ncbi:hypothetical protein GIB67_002482 [Kingdonia uniflora]|uniref:Uncharacterized protein n=1 Tax=Kingdonia uniflora TaxID=39325 RepID=A0A7J7LAJ7_9MAGN|nr:hypothetical protein GIB67_002482 [Kingdonia uniflora]